MKNLLLIILLLILTGCNNYYLDLNKVDDNFSAEDLYGTYKDADDVGPSGSITILPSGNYIYRYKNCMTHGEERGTIRMLGRNIWLVADSSFSFNWGENPTNNVIWTKGNIVRSYYFYKNQLLEASYDRFPKKGIPKFNERNNSAEKKYNNN
jgi:hypothetical protein